VIKSREPVVQNKNLRRTRRQVGGHPLQDRKQSIVTRPKATKIKAQVVRQHPKQRIGACSGWSGWQRFVPRPNHL